jgi:class 3 adenylate cyclase
MTDPSGIVATESLPVQTFRLAPLSLWKWLLAICCLLSIPVAALLQQILGSIHASAAVERRHVAIEVEKLASRLMIEMDVALQLQELLREFYYRQRNIDTARYFIRGFLRLNKVPLPYEYMIALNGAANGCLRERIRLEKRLERIVPGICLAAWKSDLAFAPGSSMVPRWAFQKLHESVLKRLTRSAGPDGENDRSYLDNIPLLQRYFGSEAPLARFVKYGGEIMEYCDPSGHRYALFWENARVNGFLPVSENLGGFMAQIDMERLDEAYGLEILVRRKQHEWDNSEIAVGWVSESDSGSSFLPFPFPGYDRQTWVEWIRKIPDGQYERSGISLAKRRGKRGMILVTARSIEHVKNSSHRKIFWMSLLVIAALIVPVVAVMTFRRNSGMAIGIRWQISGLFFLALALPCAAIFMLGSELLQDRRKAFENEAYQDIEVLKKDIEKNTSYVFRHLESVSDELARRLVQLELDPKGRIRDTALARRLFAEYVDRIHFSHMFLFNSAGEPVFTESSSDNSREGAGLQPLVQSLAKIKLRFSGNLRSGDRIGEVSMMDLLVETTGGVGQEDVRNILSNRQNRAFELKFSGRRTCFFVGEYFPSSVPDQAHILVLILRDVEFEKMFMRLMIEKTDDNPKWNKKVQLFFGRNETGGQHYFLGSPLRNPWFDYTLPDPQSLRIGRLSDPTRYDGIMVRDRILLEKDQRECLFCSFRPSCLEMITVVALFDYSIITAELQRLRLFIVVSFLVSMIVVWLLARIMARSLIEPVSLLKQAVGQVESGNYRINLSFPGKDELVDLAGAFNKMTDGLDQRERMTRYLSKSAVRAIVRGEDSVMGGKRVKGTVLFSDIRSFTTFSESNDAETVVKLLNEYFAIMNVVVEQHGGDIDKFIGDAIMAQFLSDASAEASAMALAAVKCALQMMAALAQYNQQRACDGLFPIKIGVGINSGELIAGNIGSPGRMDRTVIGDTVNVASRLEGMSKLGRHTCIIISRATYDLVRDHVVAEEMTETAVKGKTAAVQMFEVVGLKQGLAVIDC